MMETQQERRFVSAAAATAAVGVGVALYCAWQARARKLAAKEGGPPAEACPEVVPPKELSPSVNSGYLVASVKPEDGFAGYIPEDTDADGPPSTDEEESEPSVDSEISPRVDSQTWTSFRGKKEEREGSFRKRSDEKVHRAQMIKASSSSLTSFLCTPAQHNRSVESLHERKLALEPQTPPPAGSRTMTSTHRRFKDGAAEHPKRASALGLAIPEFRGRAASIAASARPSLQSIEDSTHGESPTMEGEHEARVAAVVAAMAVMGEASRASSAGKGKVDPPEALPPSAASPRLPRLNPKVKSTGLADFDSLSKMSKAKR
jgi:hypothetical protein